MPTLSAQELLDASAELARRGWVANHDGNLSVRRPGQGFLVTPTAFRKADISGVDLLVIDEDGTVRQGRHRVFSEWQLHRAVYRSRPDMNAVIHAHPPYATAMACAGRRLDPTFMAEAVVSLGPELGWVPFALPGDNALSLAVEKAAKTSNLALLGQHGVLSWGADLTMALARMELAEHLAQIVAKAQAFGGVKALSGSVVESLTAKHLKAGLAAPALKV
jgi:L-fuculose-phosphate aldolase